MILKLSFQSHAILILFIAKIEHQHADMVEIFSNHGLSTTESSLTGLPKENNIFLNVNNNIDIEKYL